MRPLFVSKSETHATTKPAPTLWGVWAFFTTLHVNLLSFSKSVFLPEGYPDSVAPDYLSYQMWDTAQALCSSITGQLSTQALLE